MLTPSLDILYFQPQEDGIPFVLSAHEIKQPSLAWGWGFRLGFEAQFARDSWILNLNWTCLPTQNDTTADGTLFPYWSNAPQTLSSTISYAKAHWRLHLGIVDFELKKPWKVSSNLTFFPRTGIRFASIRQKFYITLKDGMLFPASTDNFNTKNKYWGIGPEFGASALWTLGMGLSLVAQASYAAVYGEFYVHETERQETTHFLKFFDEFFHVASLFDLALGIEWTYRRFSIRALWEEHLYSAQNQLSLFSNNRRLHIGNLGDLALSGASFGFAYAF